MARDFEKVTGCRRRCNHQGTIKLTASDRWPALAAALAAQVLAVAAEAHLQNLVLQGSGLGSLGNLSDATESLAVAPKASVRSTFFARFHQCSTERVMSNQQEKGPRP